MRRIPMTLKNWMSAKAVICIVFGIGYVLLPETLLRMFGLGAEPSTILMTRLFGAAFIVLGLLLWLARGTAEASTKRAFGVAVLVGDATGFLIALMATLTGNVSPLGWGVGALYLILALGFGYFLLPRASRA
jgi:hypothetical protein